MALTKFQQTICRLISTNRKENGESYIAGGVALNTLVAGRRISRDIDLFHDSDEALSLTWETDKALLESNYYSVTVLRERPSYIEAAITSDDGQVLMQWARDSAFRFFPLITHDDLGLTLHPFDLATNKVLALIGRLEIRDWIDLIECNEKIQKLGFLAWAACAKDPGFGPERILEEAGRSSRYTEAELRELSFDGPPPDITELSKTWREIRKTAVDIVSHLPVEQVGKCILNDHGGLFLGGLDDLLDALDHNRIRYHEGCLKGVFPKIISMD